jgi:hypothetical protein
MARTQAAAIFPLEKFNWHRSRIVDGSGLSPSFSLHLSGAVVMFDGGL